MPVSDRKARANLANSQKSTGPKTDEGKAHSRANALKHGLSGEGVVVTDAEAVARRCAEWRPDFRVDSPKREWAFEQVVVNSIRINKCQDEERSTRDYEATRACLAWEIDKEAEAAVLGDKLGRKSEVVARQLKKSKYGCLWLHEQWTDLRGVLDVGETWNDHQLERVLDLAGMPREGRDELAPLNDPAGLVNGKLCELEELIEQRHEHLDNVERTAAEKGMPVEPSKKLALLRRYEAACVKRMNAAMRMLKSATVESIAMIAPAPVVESPPEPEPEVDEEAQRAWLEQWSREYAAKLDAYQASLETPLAPTAPIQLRDALPTPATKLAGMNRKQRRAMAKKAAQAK
jgi:hypothetical protein